jgi:hypothetical protein
MALVGDDVVQDEQTAPAASAAAEHAAVRRGLQPPSLKHVRFLALPRAGDDPESGGHELTAPALSAPLTSLLQLRSQHIRAPFEAWAEEQRRQQEQRPQRRQ